MKQEPSSLSRRRFVQQSSLWVGLFGASGYAATPDSVLTPASPNPMASTDPVNARLFGAKGDGKTDDKKSIQAALDAARSNGPICFLPAGMYRLNGSLTVPPGVTLAGASGGVPHSEHPIGTALLALGGRNHPEAEPLITLKPNAVVRNLVIHYPEQTLPEVVSYPWTIRADGELCQILDLTITNPCQAIDVGTKWNELHLIRNLFACPLKTGIDIAMLAVPVLLPHSAQLQVISFSAPPSPSAVNLHSRKNASSVSFRSQARFQHCERRLLFILFFHERCV